MGPLEQLLAIEAIKKLKGCYFRALDSKEWELMKTCLSDDCVARYSGGKYSFDGSDAIVDFFSQFMGPSHMIFMHQAHHPEIDIIDENNATGRWYLEDIVINTQANTNLHGAGFYYDEYKKVDGKWLISETGYERTFEEVVDRKNVELKYNRFDKTS